MKDYSNDAYMGKVVETDPDVFEADEVIVRSTSAARSMYEVLRSNHLKRIALAAEIDGLIQGNPPYDPKEMAQAGLQHIANFNDMSARATFERHCLAYWNLLNNAEYMTKFTLRTESPEQNYWAQILAENWDYAVRHCWQSFSINVTAMISQLVKYGISPVIFPDERDPRWRVVEYNRFFIPDQTQSDLDFLTTMCIETEYTIQYLWEVYKKLHKRKETPDNNPYGEDSGREIKGQVGPWNLIELGKLLVYWSGTTSAKNDGWNIDDPLQLEQKVLNLDISYERMYSNTVRIVSLYQKEFNGKISHYMFHRYFDMGEFVFFQHSQYEDMTEALVLFTLNPGEYTIHGNKGLGHKIFSLAQAQTMLDCSVVDMAKWASTPILKSVSGTTKDLDTIRFYPGVPTNIGSAEFVQNNLGANVNNVVGASQYLQSKIQFNLSYSGSDPSSPDPNMGSLTPRQVDMMAFKEFSVNKNAVMHYYGVFDWLVYNMTVKMLFAKESYPGYEMSEMWKSRSIQDGVPKELLSPPPGTKRNKLPPFMDVAATRVAGAGSQVAHLLGLSSLQPIMGSMGPKEEREYKRQFIMAAIGPEYVKTFMQESDQADEQAGGASLAGVENAIMQDGHSPVFSLDNEHRAHFVTHMALADQTVKGVQEGMFDVIEADKIFTVLVPHVGEHLGALSKNIFTQQFFASAKPAYDQLVKYANLNKQNASKMAEKQAKDAELAEQNEQQVMTKEQLDTFKMQKEEERKDAKQAASNERQLRAGQVKEQTLIRKTQGDLAIKRHKALVESDIKQQQAAVDNSVKINSARKDNLS